MRNGIARTLVTIGLVASGLNYLLTAFVFFSRGETLLGLIQLVIPPAELVLPWVAHPVLGAVSAISLLFVIAGSHFLED